MADGSTKPISQVRVGDQITDAVPGDSVQQTHTVQNVITTTTDRDFVDVTVKPSKLGKVLAGVALAAAATLTTTFHHPFYDITQAAFVEAVDLKPGDQVQTADGGTATVTDVHTYQQQATTYDLTISGLHTYYVLAGDTPVLVHNCTPGHIAKALDELAGKRVTTGRIFGPDQQPLGVEDGVHELGSGTDALSPQTDAYLHEAASNGDMEPIHPKGKYPMSTHVESKYATWMRDSGTTEADVVINHPEGVCGDWLNCGDVVAAILPANSVMRIWSPAMEGPVEIWGKA